jgi:hypothetical protein
MLTLKGRHQTGEHFTLATHRPEAQLDDVAVRATTYKA